MKRNRTDAAAQHRAWQELRDLIGAEHAEKVADHFAINFDCDGDGNRQVVMRGLWEVDPLRNAKPAADVAPALFEIPAAA